jgi:uncharacterized membrane protein (UPF0127 family)
MAARALMLSRAAVAGMALASLAAGLAAGGCSPGAGGGSGGAFRTAEDGTEFVRVELKGRPFELELAADEARRVRGLSGRSEISADGGMLFSFPRPDIRYFVMRDCLVPIDIIFLDADGRVTATHAMQLDEPQREGESRNAYELRLKRYSSRFSAQYAIELAGGTIEALGGFETGEQVRLDHKGLATRTR